MSSRKPLRTSLNPLMAELRRFGLALPLLAAVPAFAAPPVVVQGSGSFTSAASYTGSVALSGSPSSAVVLYSTPSVNDTRGMVITSLTGEGAALSGDFIYGAAIQAVGTSSAINAPAITVTSFASLSTNARTTPVSNPPSPFSSQIDTFGALSVRSLGGLNAAGKGGDGGAVTVNLLGGTLAVGPAPSGTVAKPNGPWDPYASAIYASSIGGSSRVPAYNCNTVNQFTGDFDAQFPNKCELSSKGTDVIGDGGKGGDVTIKSAGTQILIGSSAPSSASAPAYLAGVTALSMGGSNGWTGHNRTYPASDVYYYSNSGFAGRVNVEYQGSITSQGGSGVAGSVGIIAASIGGLFECPDHQCSDLGFGDIAARQFMNSHYDPDFNVEKPGSGGDVSVNLRSGSSISLKDGNAIGILALSAAGGGATVYWAYRPEYPTNPRGVFETAIDDRDRSGGKVTVVTESRTSIDVGNPNAKFAIGVVAMSTGNAQSLTGIVQPTYQTEPTLSWDRPVHLTGHSKSGGGAVEVTNAATINTQGLASAGLVALSVGGTGTLGGSDDFSPQSSIGSNGATSHADVTVTNTGSITTQGDYAAGIIAISASAGGIALVDLQPIFKDCDSTYSSKCNTLVAGLSVGGMGDNTGADGGAVTITHSGQIKTGTTDGSGKYAYGLVAQSIGGGGGVASGNAAFVGGSGVTGGNAGSVTVSLAGGGVSTQNLGSIGVLAQSVGGGGGTGGGALGLFVGVGGKGGTGGDAGAVQVSLSSGANIATNGDFSQGVVAQSIGGGGGTGGHAIAVGAFLSGAIGGSGGVGGLGSGVTFNSDATSKIVTAGSGGQGVVLQSIGGGGGIGGNALSASLGVGLSASLSVGGSGGKGGVGGNITATNNGLIETFGADSQGVLMQSIGGGGGLGGQSLSHSIVAPVPDYPSFNVAVSLGGSGGEGNHGGAVSLRNGQSGGTIITHGSGATAVLAQSVGGGGGAGADSESLTSSVPGLKSALNLGASISVGGSGGTGGGGGAVEVLNYGAVDQPGILTMGDGADGILAQSIGGGGGNGGIGSARSSGKVHPLSVSVKVGVGGSGGSGNVGGTVSVSNLGSQIVTYGGDAFGIAAQSIGGGGGKGGGGAADGLGDKVSINVGVGGSGGSGGHGGTVQVTNSGSIFTGSRSTVLDPDTGETYYITTGGGAAGVLAQSIGGGGGVGGSADASSAISLGGFIGNAFGLGVKTFKGLKKNKTAVAEKSKGAEFLTFNANVSVGGAGGAAGDGRVVTVDNSGTIQTLGERGFGIHAQSIGGGGGIGGAVEAAPASVIASLNAFTELTLSGVVSVGGGGGAAGNGGVINLSNSGQIATAGYGAIGIFAQSIGGGGGFGADATANTQGSFSLGLSKTGASGMGGYGGAVNVSHSGSVLTVGNDAPGILAQSIGGGGGAAQGACENSGEHESSGLSASACLGFAQVDIGQGEKIWSPQAKYVVKLGGGAGVSGNGGAVDLTLDGDIRTTGDRSIGVVAQSIGGGGGYMTAAANTLEQTVVGPNAGRNSATGGAVTITQSAKGSIVTRGNGAWGILAQSIGSGGGLAGDTSLDLIMPVSNTLTNLCCRSGQQFGADGGSININNAGLIITYGRNAHGIVAQSIGGGGGIAAGYAKRTDVNVVMGNSQQLYPGGLEAPTESGQGGAVTISNSGRITVNGPGSIGILAQSSGNKDFMSQIKINVSGTLLGGTGANAAGILVSGGDAANNGHGSTPNEVRVEAGGTVGSGDFASGRAIVATSGLTNVTNYGTITGSIDLGTTPGTIVNFGTIHAGTVLRTSANTLTNHGVLTVGAAGTTALTGGLLQSATGQLQLQPGLSANPAQTVFTVDGNANIAGSVAIQPALLLPGAKALISAANLNFTGNVLSSLLFNWSHSQSGQTLLATPTANFAPQGSTLQSGHSSLVDYIDRAWNKGEPAVASLFGYLSNVVDQNNYKQVLEGVGGRVLHQHASVALQALPVLLGQSIDCPTFGTQGVQLEQDRCVWVKMGHTQGSKEASANSHTRLSSDMMSLGGQYKVSQQWWLGGAFGAVSGNASNSSYSSRGDTWFGTLALRRTADEWTFAQSLTLGYGEYDNNRTFSLPAIGGSQLSTPVSLKSRSELFVGGLKSRVAYQQAVSAGAYIKPYADLDLVRTYQPGFREGLDNRAISLDVKSGSDNYLALSPMLEIGGRRDLSGGGTLRFYGNAGWRWTPDATRHFRISIAGAGSDLGTFEIKDDLASVTRVFNVGVTAYRTDRYTLNFELSREANQRSDANRGTLSLSKFF